MNSNLLIIKRARRLSNKLDVFLKDAARIVVIGMGNELRCDDGVGLAVVRRLKPYASERLTVFEGHMTPEVFIAPACTFLPTHLLIVDAAELHEQPGHWRLLTQDEIQDGLFTTHAFPATEVAKEIHRRCGAKIAFLGIQPKSRDVSLELSAECSEAASNVTERIQHILNRYF